jgi:hypothetical protein
MNKALRKGLVMAVEAVIKLLVKHIKQKRKLRRGASVACHKS